MHIAIIGCGQMGTALAEGLTDRHALFLYDKEQKRTLELSDRELGKSCQSIEEALEYADIAILAVKPVHVFAVSKEMASLEGKPLFSVLAGTTFAVLRSLFSTPLLFRIMPNLAVAYGEGVIGIVADQEISQEEKERWCIWPTALGRVWWLSEEKIDALTALAASGPGLFCVIAEAMIEAGIAMGFQAAESQALVYQMVRGSLSLLEQSGFHPAELKWRVASPGGTTIAGLQRLEEGAVRAHIAKGFLAAYEGCKGLK